MLSAAEDIMSKQEGHSKTPISNSTLDSKTCIETITTRECKTATLGAVLLADVVPSLIAKMTLPFFMHRLPHGVRHLMVCVLQAASYIIVASSNSIAMSLFGVVCAALGSGIGENAYLSLTAHYSGNAISAWSSGTGGAGIFGSLAYAGLTEPHLLGLSPRTTLLVMLIIPVLFYITNYTVLVPSPTIYRANISRPQTWIIPSVSKKHIITTTDEKDAIGRHAWASSAESIAVKENDLHQSNTTATLTTQQRLRLVLPLLKYMIPISVVYFAEYLINQGLTQFLVFDCANSFSFSPHSQYRWYQVVYQLGVFISRSSINFIELPFWGLLLLPVLQLANTTFFLFESIYYFIPHIAIAFGVILFEGFFGGASYVNTFHRIHKDAEPRVREYSLAVASLADAVGIVIAGFTTIPVHNFVCNLNS
ncbi:unnamed protein product [Bursaphelenchus okinawaensis]|uniref:Battenin n=1 Tax=Bursaphelenchus okinawaensis TaxID=465554 RepID=A0A811KQQ3_9BILA|nr:unnamed protein product [Bursaphelenchus okinawaensis]CAG9109265.1 unnamed protein product [Bursaphelenchus okinawaensis]